MSIWNELLTDYSLRWVEETENLLKTVNSLTVESSFQ